MCDNLRGRLIRCARGEELRGGDVGVGFSLWGSSRLYASLSFLSSPAARILRSAHARRGFSSEKKKRFSLAESLELRCHGICSFASTTISSVFDFLVSDTVRLAITPFSTPSDPKNPPFFRRPFFCLLSKSSIDRNPQSWNWSFLSNRISIATGWRWTSR